VPFAAFKLVDLGFVLAPGLKSCARVVLLIALHRAHRGLVRYRYRDRAQCFPPTAGSSSGPRAAVGSISSVSFTPGALLEAALGDHTPSPKRSASAARTSVP